MQIASQQEVSLRRSLFQKFVEICVSTFLNRNVLQNIENFVRQKFLATSLNKIRFGIDICRLIVE